MAKNMSSKPYTIHLSEDEFKLHSMLMRTGGILSRLFREEALYTAVTGADDDISYIDFLHHIISFIQCGKHFSTLWDKAATKMNDTCPEFYNYN